MRLEHASTPRDDVTAAGRGRAVVVIVVVRDNQALAASHFPLSASSSEVSAFEVVDDRRMDSPEVALAVGSALELLEALVEGEVVANAVAPALTSRVEVRVVVEDPLVDVAQHQLLLLRAQDSHGDESDVAVTGLRFFW